MSTQSDGKQMFIIDVNYRMSLVQIGNTGVRYSLEVFLVKFIALFV